MEKFLIAQNRKEPHIQRLDLKGKVNLTLSCLNMKTRNFKRCKRFFTLNADCNIPLRMKISQYVTVGLIHSFPRWHLSVSGMLGEALGAASECTHLT